MRRSVLLSVFLFLIMYHERYMERALFLARCARRHAAPNPMVGAVVVFEDRIIGEGFHTCCGKPHAEVNAIRSVSPADRPFLKESTLYVTLEPCAHVGRTPPCAALIIKTGIPRVVIGCEDPFAKVSGRGIQMLREAGVKVTVGCLEEACKRLNRRFITAQTLKRPYITLKWARSADGFIDAWRKENAPEMEDGQLKPAPPARLSTSRSMMRVHRLRAENQAILVGHSTLLSDRPALTVRHWEGETPVRIVLGRVGEDELPAGFRAYADVETMLADLHREGIQSLLVEGGGRTLQSFIDTGLWDEAFVELSSVRLGTGVPEPRMPIGCELKIEQVYGVNIAHYEND